jgi:hypothetical protein
LLCLSRRPTHLPHACLQALLCEHCGVTVLPAHEAWLLLLLLLLLLLVLW